MLASYEVFRDDNWLTRRVQLGRAIGKDTNKLSPSAESGDLWPSSPEVRGFLDFELAVTPASNTLSFWRLDLGIGKSESISAACIKFLELAMQLLPQPYTHFARNTYQYGSDTGFSAEIAADDLGLVITYPGGWERVAPLWDRARETRNLQRGKKPIDLRRDVWCFTGASIPLRFRLQLHPR